MKLISVYDYEKAEWPLWRLLNERTPDQSISHNAMPMWGDHIDFVNSIPYLSWYFVTLDGIALGAIYLTHQREIGIGIFTEHQGHGYAKEAIAELMRLHPGPFLANVNPQNEASIKIFAKFGFVHIQNTYRLEAQA